jgi:hypothetical protein
VSVVRAHERGVGGRRIRCNEHATRLAEVPVGRVRLVETVLVVLLGDVVEQVPERCSASWPSTDTRVQRATLILLALDHITRVPVCGRLKCDSR